MLTRAESKLPKETEACCLELDHAGLGFEAEKEILVRIEIIRESFSL